MGKPIHIFGGGTVQYVRSHMALCAPAYGSTARQLEAMFVAKGLGAETELQLTRMADFRSKMETNAEVKSRLYGILQDPATKVIVFNVALCDYAGQIGDVPSGKYAERLQSRDGVLTMQLSPAEKVLCHIKKQRPDVFVVGYKTTANATAEQQVVLAQRQMAESGVDMVFANDIVARHNRLVSHKFGIHDGTRLELMSLMVAMLKELL